MRHDNGCVLGVESVEISLKSVHKKHGTVKGSNGLLCDNATM